MSSLITPPPPDEIKESHVWRDWFTKLAKNVMPSQSSYKPSSITVGSSPFVYQNSNGFPIDIVISGGTVSDVAISRDSTTYYSLSSSISLVNLSSGDYLKITYSVAPTLTSIPR